MNKNSVKKKPLEIYFLTLFPEVLKHALDSSLLEKAQSKKLVRYHFVNIRSFSEDKHKTVDDRPFGGGEGMLLRVDVLYQAWKSAVKRVAQPGTKKKYLTILMSPQGKLFQQSVAKALGDFDKLILVCGHYEGVDERFIELCVDLELSIGNYVLTGGEIPALVVADAVTRLIPGVVKNPASLTEDSLENNSLKYPQYTRPRVFRGKEVPEVLLSGDHSKIKSWRDQERKLRTSRKRPDLLKHGE